ncbi:MAG: NHLP leader peptide family RiPP precursor [Xanthobacteraceae bacterium]
MNSRQTSVVPSGAFTRRDFEARVIAKAWKNPAYRQRLLSNPKGVLQQEISVVDPSVVLPSSLQVQVHEESPDIYHLVLPRNPKDISLGELLGDNLETVAPQTVAVVVVGVVNQAASMNLAVVSNIVGSSINIGPVVAIAGTLDVVTNTIANVIA